MHVALAKFWRVLAAATILAAGVAILAFGITRDSAANRDFVSYWAVGQQLSRHHNPYDPGSVFALQRAAGFKGDDPFFMRNPPTAFFLALPLGYIGSHTGAVLWIISIVLCLMAALRLLWSVAGGPDDRLHLTGYVFPPALACIFSGQTGIFLLLGAALFLYLERRRPYLAGASLAVIAVKPHLFMPFLAVLIVSWILSGRYRVAIGFATTIGAFIATAWVLDPHAWSEYSRMLRLTNIPNEFVPTISLSLRLATSPHRLWIQMIPSLVGTVWALGYYMRHREGWDWRRRGPLLLMVSVFVAPYAWFTDQALALPAVLLALYTRAMQNRSLLPYAYFVLPGLIAVFSLEKLHSLVYLWLAPAWLAWYLFVMRGAYSKRDSDTQSYVSAPVEGQSPDHFSAGARCER